MTLKTAAGILVVWFVLHSFYIFAQFACVKNQHFFFCVSQYVWVSHEWCVSHLTETTCKTRKSALENKTPVKWNLFRGVSCIRGWGLWLMKMVLWQRRKIWKTDEKIQHDYIKLNFSILKVFLDPLYQCFTTLQLNNRHSFPTVVNTYWSLLLIVVICSHYHLCRWINSVSRIYLCLLRWKLSDSYPASSAVLDCVRKNSLYSG